MSQTYEFSPERHATFLDGYMDAVGRAFTNDAFLYALTACWVHVDDLEHVLGAVIVDRTPVTCWAREFHDVCTSFLQTDGCDRLTYYLIEYIEWFDAFQPGAKASRLHCSPLPDDEIDGHRYLIEIDAEHAALLIFWKKAKAG